LRAARGQPFPVTEPDRVDEKEAKTMGRYMALWEVDSSRVPVSAQERAAGFGALIEIIKKDLGKGMLKDWGAYVGQGKGYAVAEGTEVEIGVMLQQYAPFVTFMVHPIASLSQVEEVIKAQSGQ